MPAAIQIALKIILAAATVSVVITAFVWPWPAPEVDWRTPLGRALAKSDCERAAAIMNAATQAGSVEALDMLANPASLDPCFETSALRMQPPGLVEDLRTTQRDPGSATSPVRAEDVSALDLPLRRYLETANFLCRRPYDTKIRTDYVALSAALKEEAGSILALHRLRRDSCISIIEDLITTLADRNDNPSKELACALANYPPAGGSDIARITSAKLILQLGFMPRAGRQDPFVAKVIRDTAWYNVKHLAERPDSRAMEMTIEIVHEGRYVPLGSESSSQSAYFWVLRSRRLDLPSTALQAKVEDSLTDEERARVRESEQYDWDNRRSPQSAD